MQLLMWGPGGGVDSCGRSGLRGQGKQWTVESVDNETSGNVESAGCKTSVVPRVRISLVRTSLARTSLADVK